MTPAIISLQAISKSYPLGESRVEALRDINLTIGQGEFTALEGPSGSGKSTLLNICGLLDSPDQGQFVFMNRSISGLSEKRLTRIRRQAIGFIFQGFNLMPVLSAYENVEYSLLLSGESVKARRRRVSAILEKVGLERYAGHRPDHLSGGQRQRVAIARALVKEPALIIADEPTANLDSRTAGQVIDLMHQLSREQGITFLIATHDERMASRCDRTITLTDGVIQ